MANPGYGKRSVPDQRPAQGNEFALLPERERYIAGFVDHLPDGAAMDVKGLAKQLPLYGQQAVGSALTALAIAGHLRRVRCLVGVDDQVRWVFRTFWSRTARDNEWWSTFLAVEDSQGTENLPALAPPPPWVPTETPAPPAAVADDRPAEPPLPAQPLLPAAIPVMRQPDPGSPSPAYLALAQLGRGEPRLALSAADCAALEALAGEWLARGVSTEYLTRALSCGLPAQIGSPVGFVRRRLSDKLPPALPATTADPAAPGRRPVMECTDCGVPGYTEALPDGLCRPCREGATRGAQTPPPPPPAAERDVRAYVSNLRDLLKSP